jgi:hypothetical protein
MKSSEGQGQVYQISEVICLKGFLGCELLVSGKGE